MIRYLTSDFGNYEMIKKLNGKVILICGNYEEFDYANDFEGFKNRLLGLGFDEVYKTGIYLDESVVGERMFLTHRPLSHAKDCLNLFGHVHTLAPLKSFGFNVCVTYHGFAPVSTNTIKRYINFIKTMADDEALS